MRLPSLPRKLIKSYAIVSAINFEYHSEAEAELNQSFDWYHERSPQAAADFLVEMDHAVAQVTNHPKRWPAYLHGTRHYKLRRFPYVLVYLQLADKTYGIAVAHLSRKPGYWKKRVS